jgi:uncharacterized damage-inducible protein DinB
MFALYNRWDNRQLYSAAERCTAEQLRSDRGGFLRSILGTLNHLLVTDRMWLRRLKGNTPRAVDLGEILYDDFPDLAEART